MISQIILFRKGFTIVKNKRKIVSLVLAATLTLSSAWGGFDATAAQAAKKATIKTKSITVAQGKSKTIQIKNKKAGFKYSFQSNKKKVAKVSTKGKVTGVSAGTAKITVKEQKKGKAKTKKIGTVKVKVNKKKVAPIVTTSPSAPVASTTPVATKAPVTPTKAPVVTSTPAIATSQPTIAPTKAPSKNYSGTSVKVYVDSMEKDNLVGTVVGPGIVPTPTPVATESTATATPVPTPQVIFNCDFENDSVDPFTGRGDATPSIAEGGANDSSKCMLVSGRVKEWNGTQIDITNVVETEQKYSVSFWVKQVSDGDMKINTTFQYVDTAKETKYDTQNSATIPANKWTEVTFTTQEVPEHVGDISLYWETPYNSGVLDNFYIDDFKMEGVAKVSNEEAGIVDISAGLDKETFGNPSITSRLTADPYAMEYNGRVYVYGTNDTQQYNKAPDAANNYDKINTLNCFSSSDMINWTDHGEIAVGSSKGAAKWAGNSWAPAIAHKKINGKEKFFLYFANSANSIGVLTADSPTGPWTDPVGKALIDRNTPGCSTEDVPWLFDPAVLVDDDGKGYLYFGGIGDTTDKSNEFIANPKCSRVIRLGDDMVSTEGEAEMIDAPYMFEDSGINKIGSKYYYSYCTNWTNIAGRDVPTANIAVMESDNPTSGFKYVGTVMKNPGNYFGAYGNNHHCFAEFKGVYYAFYHTKNDSVGIGLPQDYRTTYVDVLNLGDNGNFTNTDNSVADTKMTAAGVEAVGKVNPFEYVEAETYGISQGTGTLQCDVENSVDLWKAVNRTLFNKSIGSYTGIGSVDFGDDGATSITMMMADSTDNEYDEITTQLSKKVTGTHTLYFVFEKENVLIDKWKFE